MPNNILHNLDKPVLLQLLLQYDEYIQDANDKNLYKEGWYPVCLNEFYDNEFQEIEGQPENQVKRLLEANGFSYVDFDPNGFDIYRKDNIDVHIDIIQHEDNL